jgi:hypothetical protein
MSEETKKKIWVSNLSEQDRQILTKMFNTVVRVGFLSVHPDTRKSMVQKEVDDFQEFLTHEAAPWAGLEDKLEIT